MVHANTARVAWSMVRGTAVQCVPWDGHENEVISPDCVINYRHSCFSLLLHVRVHAPERLATAAKDRHIVPLQSDTMSIARDKNYFEPTVNVTEDHLHLACITAVSVSTKISLETRRLSELKSEDIAMGPAWQREGETWADFEASSNEAT